MCVQRHTCVLTRINPRCLPPQVMSTQATYLSRQTTCRYSLLKCSIERDKIFEHLPSPAHMETRKGVLSVNNEVVTVSPPFPCFLFSFLVFSFPEKMQLCCPSSLQHFLADEYVFNTQMTQYCASFCVECECCICRPTASSLELPPRATASTVNVHT